MKIALVVHSHRELARDVATRLTADAARRNVGEPSTA